MVLNEDGKGGEGIPALLLGDQTFPAVSASASNVTRMMPILSDLATESGKTIVLRRYSEYVTMEVIEP